MDVSVILVPWDSGVRDARMGRGPLAIMEAGLVERLEQDGHVVASSIVHLPDASLRAEVATSFALQRAVAVEVLAACNSGALPLVLSGNCNTAVGTVGALRSAGLNPGTCWFDAHADFNTPDTSESGFLDGMAVSILTGDCWTAMTAQQPGFRATSPRDIIMIGTRDVDAAERERMQASGVRVVQTDDIERGGVSSALDGLSADLDAAYLHVDLDVLDPSVGRANGFAAPHGLGMPLVTRAVDDITAHLPVRAMALTAYDPACDAAGHIAHAAVELAAYVARLAH